MSYVPYEMIVVIFQYLPLDDVMRLSRVSRTWYKAFRFHYPLDNPEHLRDLLGICVLAISLSEVKYILDHCEDCVLGFQDIQYMACRGDIYVEMIQYLMESGLLKGFDVNDLLGFAKSYPRRNTDLIKYLESIIK